MFHNRVMISGQNAVAVAATSEPLETGTYAVWAEAAAFIKVGKSVDDVSAENGYPVFVGAVVNVAVFEGERIGATAAVSIMKVGT